MEELRQRYGLNRRTLPLHALSDHLGVAMSICLKAQAITGQDSISKRGTKHCALLSDPVQYLINFGESGVPSEQDICLAEQHHVRRWIGARYSTK